ncbi:MAG: DUF4878 domain-containing protein [Ferruginibacter sp.]|nr:DUF4878 domain-containing protein [Chitinophagaceae bacterium]MBP6287789.1 DUF4878 domain-containing protein [Ferruginibacter sp.]
MKKIIFILAIATSLAACNSNDAGPSTSSPTATIDGMFNAMKNGQIDDFKKFITKNDAAMIEEGMRLANSIDSNLVKKAKETMADEFKEKVKNVSYKLKNEKIDGDNATVDAEVTENGKTETHAFNLVKEDGAWKIALSKSGDGMFNSMKGDRGPGEPDLKEAMEKLNKMDKDTLKMLMEKASQVLDSIKAKKTN